MLGIQPKCAYEANRMETIFIAVIMVRVDDFNDKIIDR